MNKSLILKRAAIFNLVRVVLMALPAVVLGADPSFQIPPVPVTIDMAGQPVAITISGDVSPAPARRGESEQSINLNLSADLSGFQNHLTPLLQAEMNQSNRCGERISIENATLVPAAPAGRLTVQLHFEKWICFKALGKENAKRLVGGNGTVQVLLTPRVEGDQLRLDADVSSIEANGSLGDVLRSEPVGTALRDKIRDALLKAIRKSTDFQAVVPAQAQPWVTLQSAAFTDLGGGRIALSLAGRLRVPGQQVAAILEQFRNRP